tara:strand:- start:3116 stop:3661 length:546 start_codon:yes stop_codon:yes gene_type:complete
MRLIGGKKDKVNWGILKNKILFIDFNDEKILSSLEKKIEKNLISSMTKRTNVKGKMTSWNCFTHDKDFEKITEFINPYLFKFLATIKNNINKVELLDAWGNRLNKNDYIQKHNHIVGGWSGISGNMYFSNKQPGTYFVDFKGAIQPKRGRIVLFDSKEMHLVDVVKDNDPRYTLAFNMKYE